MTSHRDDPVPGTASSSAPVAAIAALELESAILERLPRASAAHNAFGYVVYRSGPGPARASLAARQAIEAGASALLSFGLAGGLRPGLDTGAVILPHTVADASGRWECDAAWCRQLESALGGEFPLMRVLLVSVDRVATSIEQKRALAARHDAVAVDMESAAIAREAASAGLPFAALRVVADGPDDALPSDVEALVTADGRTHLPGLLGYLTAPQRLPALIRLGRRSGRARAVLIRLADALARSGAAVAPKAGAPS